MKAKEKTSIREIAKILKNLDSQSLILIKHGAMVLEFKKQIDEEAGKKNEKKK